MILVDTSIWIDHLHAADVQLVALLERDLVASHPMILGELALGSIKNRHAVLELIGALAQAPRATDGEVLHLIEAWGLSSSGLGLVDAHLLAACRLDPAVRLWSRDRRLADRAASIGVGWTPG